MDLIIIRAKEDMKMDLKQDFGNLHTGMERTLPPENTLKVKSWVYGPKIIEVAS